MNTMVIPDPNTARAIPGATTATTPIPNINIGQEYDQRYAEADVHYEGFEKLADFFGRNMPVHRHDRFFQVHLVMSGVVRVYLDDRLYVVEGPMFFVTPPTIPHAFVTETGSTGHVLTVRQQLVWSHFEGMQAGSLRGCIDQPLCVALDREAQPSRELMTLFALIATEFADVHRSGRELALQALTRLLFVHLLRYADQNQPAQAIRKDEIGIFHRFNELIEAHYQEHWTLDRYAGKLNISESRLNDICRRLSDLPSKRLVHDRVVQEAKRLLMFTDHSVTEIAYTLGFNDPAYFARFFRRATAMTASEYRQREAI